jgi:hypothetical protein
MVAVVMEAFTEVVAVGVGRHYRFDSGGGGGHYRRGSGGGVGSTEVVTVVVENITEVVA